MVDEKKPSPSLATAKKRALYLLGGRDYSSAELYKKLLQNYPVEICDEVIEWINELGYINDREYAEKLLHRLISKGYGRRKIRYEMSLKGIPDDMISELLDTVDDGCIRNEIKGLLIKKYSDKIKSGDRGELQKIINALLRRGFDYDDVKPCLAEIAENTDM